MSTEVLDGTVVNLEPQKEAPSDPPIMDVTAVDPPIEEIKAVDPPIEDITSIDPPIEDFKAVVQKSELPKAETKAPENVNKFITLNLILPQSTESIKVTIGTHDHLHELRQMANERPESCYKTCFTLQHRGKILDEFAMVHTVENLTDGETVKCVAEQYSLREARLHLKRVRSLIQPDIQVNAQNGVDNLSLTFAGVVAGRDVEEDIQKGVKEDHGCDVDVAPPDYLFAQETPLLPLFPETPTPPPECVSSIGYSGWNPPPGNRRMLGDLFYLIVTTLEGNTVHITAVPSGFYVNKTTSKKFDPTPAEISCKGYTLVDTLKQVSSLFNKNFAIIQKQSLRRNPYEVIPVPYPTFTWCKPESEHTYDTLRAEEAYVPNSTSDEMSLGMMSSRDWNEELQSARELPQANVHEKIVRDRTIFRVTCDFVAMAIKGAQAVVDGNIPPLNAADDKKSRMFLWNNIFFSLGFDMKDHYGAFGGDSAAYAAIAGDLRGISLYQSLDTDGLHTLGTVIVDYRGYRVVGQSIISGILSRDQEQSIIYGSIDNGKSINSNDKFGKVLESSSKKLHLREHSVIGGDGEEHRLITSYDCKGIIGNDGRHYLIDLFRSFAPDVFALGVPIENYRGEEEEQSKPMFMCPETPHKLATLRAELIEAFACYRYVLFTQNMSAKFIKAKGERETKLKAIEETKEKEEVKEIKEKDNESDNDSGCSVESPVNPTPPKTFTESDAKEILEEIKSSGTARQFGSVTDTEFDMRYNPDIYTNIGSNDNEHDIKHDRQIVQEMAVFLSDSVIVKFVYELKTMTQRPLDAIHLSDLMHGRGINMRYLGGITKSLEDNQEKNHNYAVCLSAVITRAAKQAFKKYIIDIPSQQLGAAVAHFLNCYHGTVERQKSASGENSPPNGTQSKKKKNKKGKVFVREPSCSWSTSTTQSIHSSICEIALSKFDYTLPVETGQVVMPLGFLPMTRLICRAVGIQLTLRDYSDNRYFTESDVMNVFPIVKHSNPRARDATKLKDLAEDRLGNGYLGESHELITDALNTMLQVYGPLHSDIESSHKHLAHISYLFGRIGQAVSHQKQGLLASERVLGIDHYETIYCYVYLALFAHNLAQTSVALRLMYRAKYLLQLIFGPDHLEQAAFDINIGLMLHTKGDSVNSQKFLESALKLHKKFHGSGSVQVAMCNILVARALAGNADFREAMKYQKHAFEVYSEKYGEDDKRTKDCQAFLSKLTQKAVELQKWLQNKEKVVPNMVVNEALPDSTISEMLATVNGIPATPSKIKPIVSKESEAKKEADEKLEEIKQQGDNEDLD
ncbi:clustered mitochondria protein homolog [Bolinopsis microptera]|uniref:clustered mitochondria protein homolog n=1 Tax=Bolinopsis microptera TaxID=2820187 RepID=UPI00307A8331